MNLDGACFYSNDIEKAVDFYTNKLGLKIDYQRKNEFVSFVFPNGGKLSIKKATEEREAPGHQTVFISVNNILEIVKLVEKEKLEVYKPQREFDWGKVIDILDPDKNKVEFIERN